MCQSDLYDYLKLFSDLRLKYHNKPDIEAVCIDVCGTIVSEIVKSSSLNEKEKKKVVEKQLNKSLSLYETLQEKYWHDPEIRRLCGEIISLTEKEMRNVN